jgi:hypothetical protein
MKRAPLVTCLVLATALVAGLASWALGPGGHPPSPHADAAAPALRALQAEVSALVTSMERLREREDEEEPTPLARPALDAGRELASLRSELAAAAAALGDLQRGMRALEQDLRARELEIRALPVRLGGATAGSLVDAVDTKPETDWRAVEQLARSWSLDREATRRELMFRGPHELLARLGPPTHVGGEDDGETRWTWLREAPDGGWDLRASLALRDGYVAAVDVRRR